MKSEKCPRPRRQSFSASSKIAKSVAWVAKSKRLSTCASWPPPTKIPNKPSPAARCARIYISVSTYSTSTCPRFASTKKTFPCSENTCFATSMPSTARNIRGIGAEVLDIFMSHTWPGNIRELRNVLERATIMSEKDLISRAPLPGEFGKVAAKSPSDLSTIKFPIGTTVDAMERELILQTLAATGNNKTRAAELLGVSLKTLHNKLKEYGSDRAETES